MNVIACVVAPVIAVAPKGAVEELRSLGMAAVFYQDFETLTGDGGPSFPSSSSGTDLQGMNVHLVSTDIYSLFWGFWRGGRLFFLFILTCVAGLLRV